MAVLTERGHNVAMSASVTRGVDLLAVAAACLAAVMTAVYVWGIRAEGDQPALWALIILVAGGLGAAYGSRLNAPHRRPVLVIAAIGLAVLGVLAILSIGLPIALAGLLAYVASTRSHRDAPIESQPVK
jgi:hypothetical protein